MILGSKLLIYNRVPKAGSSTLLTIIRDLHYKHKKFSYETSEIFDVFTLTIPEELSLLAGITLCNTFGRGTRLSTCITTFFNRTRDVSEVIIYAVQRGGGGHS